MDSATVEANKSILTLQAIWLSPQYSHFCELKNIKVDRYLT